MENHLTCFGNSTIIIPMKTILDNTASTLRGLHGMNRNLVGPGADRLLPILLAVTPAVFAAFALGEIGSWVLDEIARQVRIREKRPDSPSLRGKPTPADLEREWAALPRRDLATCLRLGSRLADLDPTLDRTLLCTPLPSGKKLIRSRKGGMKGWLCDHRVRVGYSTAMRYKKLVQRLRHILALDDRLPFEWVMDGLPDGQSLPADLAAPFSTARRRLATILRENHSLAALSRFAEAKLGIVRLVTVSRVRPVRHRATTGKLRKSHGFSVISHDCRANVSPGRLDATKQAMARILMAGNSSGPARHLRNRIAVWLSGIEHSAASH